MREAGDRCHKLDHWRADRSSRSDSVGVVLVERGDLRHLRRRAVAGRVDVALGALLPGR